LDGVWVARAPPSSGLFSTGPESGFGIAQRLAPDLSSSHGHSRCARQRTARDERRGSDRGATFSPVIDLVYGVRPKSAAAGMDLILLFKAFVLGIVEGLTEFLPVSSTGHLIIAGDALGFTGARADTFGIFIQLGAILGVVWLYRARVLEIAAGIKRPAERKFALSLLLALLPAAGVGVLTHQYIKAYLFSTDTVAWALIGGGIAILVIERWQARRTPRIHTLAEISYGDAFKIGIAQTVSLIPGVSRAGATIMGGMLFGLSRTAATEFSFFLAMPTMFAAVAYDLAKSLHALEPADVAVFAVGFITAFLSAIVVVRTFLVYIGRHTFLPFAWYRVAFGSVLLLYLHAN
jgi:undecaprenyl-diphosphatase